MAAQVVSLFQRLRPSHDWTQRELAEFYRVESALIQAGLQLETDRGVSDEGDPWFVFCRADNGEVFIHFARIDGQYIAVGAALEQVVQGKDFPTLVQEMLAAQAFVMAKARNHSNIFLHPAALLIALVGGAFFHSSEAKAAETADHGRSELRRHALPTLIWDAGERSAPALDPTETTTILSSVLIGLNGLTSFGAASADAAPVVLAGGALELFAPPPPLAPLSSALSAPASQAASLISDPVAPQTPFELQPQHLSASPGLGLDLAPAATSGVVAAQPAVDLAAFSGIAASGVHLELAAPIVSDSVVILQAASTEAAEIVQSSSVLSYLEAQPNLTPPPPPAALTGLINHGEQITLPAAPQTTAAAAAATQTTTTETLGGSTTVAVASASSDSVSSVPHGGIDPQISAVVSHFAAEASVLDVAFSGNEIILYDGAILKPLPAGTLLESMTYNFSDGSSISLVGTATELHNLHLS